jgi:membrane protease YdiL (CAAX protease family)
VKRRLVTAPSYGREEPARRPRALAFWLALVGALIVVAYAGRASSGKPGQQFLYHWSTGVGAIVQDGIVLVLVLWIAGFSRDLLALRRPRSFGNAAIVLVSALVAVYLFEGIYSALAHPGNEQGLTPAHWEPSHAAAYVVNSIVICTWVPFVEELTYRGLGCSLLEPYGQWTAILVVGLLFGLSHGLFVSLPVIALFGCVLAWVRFRTDSVFPGMALHGAFNLIALVAAVTIHR